jgi:hypothetical protein
VEGFSSLLVDGTRFGVHAGADHPHDSSPFPIGQAKAPSGRRINCSRGTGMATRKTSRRNACSASVNICCGKCGASVGTGCG